MDKTTNYELFKFTKDNRPINNAHLNHLVNSIKNCNMLPWRPIVVNGKMEVLDGQHRLTAAKQLGLPVYYQIRQDSIKEDIIHLNVQKNWNNVDYANFHFQNGKKEYKHLYDFAKKYAINIRTAIYLVIDRKEHNQQDFKNGRFVFNSEIDSQMDICKDAIALLKRVYSGPQLDWATRRLWEATYRLVNQPQFNWDQFEKNAKKLSSRYTAKPTLTETYKQLIEIFNYNSSNRIEIE